MAEWWKRLVAILVDSVIISIPMYILYGVMFVGLGALEPDAMTEEELVGFLGALAGVGLLVVLLSLVVPILYYGIMNGSPRGQTVGKMVMKIQVRDEVTGGPIGIGKGILRYLVVIALSLPCGIPALIDGLSPLWDPKRQSWHDKAVRSVVVDA